jgi:hypothetical protein
MANGAYLVVDHTQIVAGHDAGAVALTMGGTLTQHEGETELTGALVVAGGSTNASLTIVNAGTFSVTSSLAAVMVSQGTVTVANDGSQLFATGGLDIGNGGIVFDNGAVTASAGAARPALAIEAGGDVVVARAMTLTGGVTVDGQLVMDNGTFTESGAMTVTAGGTVSGSGSVSAAIDNGGLLSAIFGSLSFLGDVSGTGTLALGVEGALALLGSVAGTVEFANAGTVTLGDVAGFHASIAGWATGDVLDLLGVAAVSKSVSGQTLKLFDSNHLVVASLAFTTPITAADFALKQDGHGNTVVSYHA